MLDTLPTTRHVFSVSNMLPGIRFVTPDIGGSRQMEQTNPRGHGVNGAQAQEAIDGMSTSSQESNIVWTYVNDSLVQEVSVTTAAHPAEVQGAAMRMNMIPKDGGNTFSGSVFLGGSDGNWQATNIDDYLRSQNITRGNGIAHVQTFNGSLGGPVNRDRLWFFVTARHASTDEVVANVGETITTPQGEQLKSTIDQYIRDALGRLTWQINQKNKFAAFFNRTWKRKGKDFGAGSDPRAGSYRDPRTGKYAVGQAKYTNTLTGRWLLEAGYSSPINHITIDNEPGISLPRYLANGQFNPAWLANARRTDTANNINPRCALAIGCRAWVSNGQDQRTIATGHRTVASASYVTGTHNVKFGIDRSFGWARVYTERQADLVQNYQNNRATNVTVLLDARGAQCLRELRPRLLRAGCLDDQAADAERRPSGRQLPVDVRGNREPSRPLRARTVLPRAAEAAELEQRHRAPAERRVRPVRERPHRHQRKLEQILRAADRRLCR